MYALVILLTGLGFLALQRAIEAPRPGNLAAVALVAAALLYTQYWSLYLVGVTGCGCSSPLCATGATAGWSDAPVPAFLALVVGCVLFLPWVPTFIYQSQHTATPVGRAAQLLRRHQRRHRLQRQPGLDLGQRHQPGSPARRHLLRHAGPRPLRPGQDRSHHRARPAHPPALARRHLHRRGHALRRHRRRHHHPQRVLVALRRRGLPAAPPRDRAGHHHAAQSQGAGGRGRRGRDRRARLLGPERHHPAHPGRRRSPRPSTRTPRRATSSPSAPTSSARRSTARWTHTAHYDMLTFPRRTSPAIVDWVDYANNGRRGQPRAPSPTTWPRRRPAPTPCGWSGSPNTRPTASSARRSPPT